MLKFKDYGDGVKLSEFAIQDIAHTVVITIRKYLPKAWRKCVVYDVLEEVKRQIDNTKDIEP